MKRVWMAMAILSLCATGAFAQPGVNGIGFSIGVVDVDNVESSSIGFGVFADLGLPTMPFSIQPYVDYWSNSEDVTGIGEISARDIAVGAKGLFNFPLANPVVKPFIGAGLGMHFLKAETPAIDMGASAKAGIDAPADDFDGDLRPQDELSDTDGELHQIPSRRRRFPGPGP